MGIIYSIGLWIVTGIYHVVAYAFKIFLILASGELISAESYKLLIENFYVIIGVIMLFFLAFALLRGMVNPDDKKQGTETVKKVVINLITSSIMLIVLPSVFSFLFDFQDAVIVNQNVIGRFFGYGGSETNNVNTEQNTQFKQIEYGANQITNGVFTAFFNVNYDDYCVKQNHASGNSMMEALESCQDSITVNGNTFKETIQKVDQTASFGSYVDFADEAADHKIDFNFLLGLIGGLLLIYVAVSFCFDMAVRLVKLVFYQLIAPVPIFMRIIPEGKFNGVFGNWLKVTLTCYFEVYVRILIFYFCVYLCNAIKTSSFLSGILEDAGPFTWLLTKAFIFMGLITFMKQAPKLISDVTGLNSGNMKLGIRDKLAAGGAFTVGAVAGGGITTLARNAVSAGRATWNKYKQGKEQKLSTTAAIRSSIGTGFKGIGSVLAGTVSGAARGLHGGWSAKSETDMRKAAGSAAKGAGDAKDRRAAYKARHGGTVGGAIGGHVEDLGYNISRWAGIGNVDSLIAENKLLDQISSERKAIDTEARALILDELEKGKADAKISIGLGGAYSIEHLRNLKSAIDAAKSTKTKKVIGEDNVEREVNLTAAEIAQRISAAETSYSDYLKNWQDALVDESLQGQSAWEDLKKDPTKLKYIADMSKVRQASDKYRETVSRNLSVPYFAELSGATDIADKEKSLTHDHAMLDTIKDVMKIHKTENERRINEANQRAAEASGKQ